ncbi:MAG: hypothetical protein H0W76_08290 [Pyrinomonadaceae bacterium]|nr:hypothetical protein [Pyrinomonadaceae bacterium]
MATTFYQDERAERRRTLLEKLNTAHLALVIGATLMASVGSAYVTTRLAENNLQWRVLAVEAHAAEAKEARSNYVTREESRIQWEYLRNEVTEVKGDVKEIRALIEARR